MLREQRETTGHVRLPDQLGYAPEQGEVLVGDLDRRRHNQEQHPNRLPIHRVHCDAATVHAEGEAEPPDRERAAMGNGDPAAVTGRAQDLATQELSLDGQCGFVGEPEEGDEVAEYGVPILAGEIEGSRGGLDEIGEAHTQ